MSEIQKRFDGVVEQVALGLRDGGVVGAKIMPIAVTSGHPRALVEILEMSFLFEADRQLSKWITVPLGSKSYALVDVLGALGIHQVAIDGRSSWRDLARILATNIESIRRGYGVHGEAHLAQLVEEEKVRRTSKSLAHSATTRQRVEFQRLKDEAARIKDEKARTNKGQSSD